MADEPGPGASLVEGRYRIERTIGSGGMATVFVAWDLRLRAWRALKFLQPAYASDDELRRRFENEAHAMARLEHRNIVRVYDVGVAQGIPFIAMELVDGGSLDEWLDRFGRMPPRLAVKTMIDVAGGIAAAHAEGVVHRDIKPHNLLVDRKGNCKVTDFGIARIESDDGITQTGTVMGTLGFMAPEQRIDTKGTDGRGDIYSIGATLFALVTGRKKVIDLFAADEAELIEMGVFKPLVPALLRATRYRREERFETADELGDALGHTLPFLPDDPPETTLISSRKPSLPPTETPSRPPGDFRLAPKSGSSGPTMVPGDDQLVELEQEMLATAVAPTPPPARRRPPSLPPTPPRSGATPRPEPRSEPPSTRKSATPPPVRRPTDRPAEERAAAAPPTADSADIADPADAAKDAAQFGGQIVGAVFRMAMQPALIFSLVTVILGALWVIVAYSGAAPVRHAAAAATASQAVFLSSLADNEPKIREDLVALGTKPDPLDKLYSAVEHEKSEADRMRAASQLLALISIEIDTRRQTAPPTVAYKVQLVSDRLKKVREARVTYDQSVKVWRDAAADRAGRVGIAMGFAPAPPAE